MSGEIAKKTVEAYFEGLNHDNSSELLKVSHFPHFRISPKGELIVFETPNDFMQWFYNKTNSDNWHHSELNKINTCLLNRLKTPGFNGICFDIEANVKDQPISKNIKCVVNPNLLGAV